MSSEATVRRNRRSLPSRGRHYEVGYGKPPAATRFKPGQSGNPLGRSKGSGNSARPSLNEERLKSIILDEAYRTISVNDANGPIAIPMAQAVIRSLAVNAAKGSRDPKRAIEKLGIFQSIPDEPITTIRRIIVDPKERPTLADSLSDEELAAIIKHSDQ